MRLFGHPLHPMLVHFPIAFWTLATISDGLALSMFADTWDYGWMLLALGLCVAAPAMIAGALELAALPAAAEQAGHRHMIFMGAAWTSYLVALMLRLEGGTPSPTPQAASVAFSMLGFISMSVGGWFGGQLVYRYGAGHSRTPDMTKSQ